MPRRYVAIAFALAVLAGSIEAAQIQQRGRPGGFFSPRQERFAVASDFDGSFQFCRIVFRRTMGGDGSGWNVDYPRADENLSIRLSELTKTPVGLDEEGAPRHVLIDLSSPELFRCPFIMMTEVGSLYMDEVETKGLHDYLQKGGFLWVDDFWGTRAWDVFERAIHQVLPSGAFPIVDLPMDHPIFHMLMTVDRFPQIPSIGSWGGPGGPTSERGPDSATPHARAILDGHGRVMVFITHNTDLGDSFEREGDNRQYFLQFSVPGYGVGINVLLYAMTH